MKAFFKFLLGLLTDAKNRPEIKNVIGIFTVIVAFVYLFIRWEASGFAIIFGLGGTMIGLTTIGDAVVDSSATEINNTNTATNSATATSSPSKDQ